MNSSNQRGTEGLLELVVRAEQVAKRQDGKLISDLTYVNYAANRDRAPEITPERWERIYGPTTPAMEARYQRERSTSCDASEARRGDVFAEPCGKKAVAGTYRCSEHTEE